MRVDAAGMGGFDRRRDLWNEFLKMFQLFGDPSGQARPDHNRSLD